MENKLDMNSIADLFFAVDLMQTALAHVLDGDKVAMFEDELSIETDHGYIRNGRATIDTHYHTSSIEQVEEFGEEVIRLSQIMRDLYKYPFKCRTFKPTKVNIGRYEVAQS